MNSFFAMAMITGLLNTATATQAAPDKAAPQKKTSPSSSAGVQGGVENPATQSQGAKHE